MEKFHCESFDGKILVEKFWWKILMVKFCCSNFEGQVLV